MEIVEGIRNFFQSLTVLGWFIFVVALVAFLVTSAVFLLRRDGDRYAWFMVILVAIFLGIGLRYGIPYATELLSYGIADSLIWVPKIQQSVGDAIDMGAAPWTDGNPQPTLTIGAGDVTIISTSGPPTPVPDVPTSTPEAPTATPTMAGEVGGIDLTGTLTPEDIATIVVIQQLTATYTPRPPTAVPAVPTLDMSNWNPQTPAPTRGPGG